MLAFPLLPFLLAQLDTETDRSFLSNLFTKYEKLVHKWAYHGTHNNHDSADIAQEVFLNVVENLHAFQEKSDSATAYALHEITRQRLRTYYRKSNRETLYEHEIDFLSDNSILAQIEDYVVGKDIKRKAVTELSMLPKKQRSIIILKDCGYKHREIASFLEITDDSSKKELQRGREKLLEQLEGELHG